MPTFTQKSEVNDPRLKSVCYQGLGPKILWNFRFKLGYPRKAFRQINHFVRDRLGRHLQRRSQRGWRAPKGVSLYAHLDHLGLVYL